MQSNNALKSQRKEVQPSNALKRQRKEVQSSNALKRQRNEVQPNGLNALFDCTSFLCLCLSKIKPSFTFTGVSDFGAGAAGAPVKPGNGLLINIFLKNVFKSLNGFLPSGQYR